MSKYQYNDDALGCEIFASTSYLCVLVNKFERKPFFSIYYVHENFSYPSIVILQSFLGKIFVILPIFLGETSVMIPIA